MHMLFMLKTLPINLMCVADETLGTPSLLVWLVGFLLITLFSPFQTDTQTTCVKCESTNTVIKRTVRLLWFKHIFITTRKTVGRLYQLLLLERESTHPGNNWSTNMTILRIRCNKLLISRVRPVTVLDIFTNISKYIWLVSREAPSLPYSMVFIVEEKELKIDHCI